MDRGTEMNDVILLFDNYSSDSERLFTSFKLAGYDYPAAVIEDDGFLPEGLISVYGFFLGDFRIELGNKARAKYFNEIRVPDFWEISGNNSIGKVHDLSKERGKIFYAEPKYKRLVRVVDWYDERGVVRSSDHYNQCGALYARTVYNSKGQKVNRSYFSVTGQEIIVENFVTGDILLNEDGETKIFRSKTDFVIHFLIKAGFRQKKIFFNSLSTPFFVSNRLSTKSKQDVLFWQESIGTEIPGNMQIILRGQASRTKQIMVQKKSSYDRLMELGAKAEIVHRLGFVYHFEKENNHQPELLICTNSDNIEHCRELIEALPEIHFHIAALTEMSSKLMSMDSYENVSLYPGVKRSILDELFEKCDFYFDINHESEIVSAVSRAFMHNHLIFAFAETVHNRDYVAEEHIYRKEDVARMISDVRAVLANGIVLREHLQKQKDAALAEGVEAYRSL
jgi:accessory Sec system glycosyltransferase GtfB